MKERTGTYCKKCGFRIRGKNHEAGIHHKTGKDRKMGQTIVPRKPPTD
jgi:hypothetical protein